MVKCEACFTCNSPSEWIGMIYHRDLPGPLSNAFVSFVCAQSLIIHMIAIYGPDQFVRIRKSLNIVLYESMSLVWVLNIRGVNLQNQTSPLLTFYVHLVPQALWAYSTRLQIGQTCIIRQVLEIKRDKNCWFLQNQTSPFLDSIFRHAKPDRLRTSIEHTVETKCLWLIFDVNPATNVTWTLQSIC